MDLSNNINIKENEGINPSFSFSCDKNLEVNVKEILSKLKFTLQEILNTVHTKAEKRAIYVKHERWNFACPYCGDSGTDVHKKRGNIYINKFYYKCYNCNKYRNIKSFLKDFNKNILNIDEEIFLQKEEENARKEELNFDTSYLYNVNKLKDLAIDRNIIEEKFRLIRVDKSPILTYLQKRFQPNPNTFSWNREKEQLYIFNLIPDTNLVLGYQIRNFKSYPKYMTFRLSKIYELLEKKMPEDVNEIDEISTIFGILNINFSKPVTVFEGPLDSFLYANSIATCSINIDFPFELSSLRYFYDYDKPGRDEALKKLNEGKSVFLWKKFFKESQINEPLLNKKMDLTDLVIYAKRKGISIPKLSNFFSHDKYDAYWI